MAPQAELVPGRHRRPHDPAAGATRWPNAGSIVTDSPGSHAVYVSQPDVVADLIEQVTRQLVSA
jgi:hypothetical protein